MKVCTDACLFGAWVAQYIKETANVLDIGTGTGLLSLMYAQQHPEAIIDAVEIDISAAAQARENFNASPWSSRLTIYSSSIQQFNSGLKYDLIISNPPFFENDLRSANPKRNNAMHDTSLTLEELANTVVQHLSPNGIFTILLPYHRVNYFIEIMEKVGLFLSSKLLMKQSIKHDYFRSVLCFSLQKKNSMNEEIIIIREKGNSYSQRFSDLLKDYYLH